MAPDLIVLAAGFALLIAGAHALVEAASSLAARAHVPPFVIGLTVVAVGTSLPELAVNWLAAWRGTPDLAMGNIMGSNLANILLILGLAATVRPLPVRASSLRMEVPLGVAGPLLVALLGLGAFARLSRWEGALLVGIAVVYTVRLFLNREPLAPPPDTPPRSFPTVLLLLTVGVVLLVLGGDFIVRSSILLARRIGMSEAVIGLTVVAVGTSLPELATSVVAALRRAPDIAVGNIMGSNLYNVFLVLGTTAILRPMPLGRDLLPDILAAAGAAAVLWAMAAPARPPRLGRTAGILFLALYASYMGWRLWTT